MISEDGESESVSDHLEGTVFLGAEPAWSADHALEAIEHLAELDLAVVGVELWRNDDGAPHWLASSDYNHDGVAEWTQRVRKCARDAAGFVRRFRTEPDALFNLTWVDQAEADSLGAREALERA